GEPGDVAVGGAPARTLFDDADEIAGWIGFALEVCPAEMRARVTGVDEPSIRQGGRPRCLRHPQRAPEDADRFRRHAWRIDTGGRGAGAGSTERLLIPEDADLVAPGHLPR